MKKKLILVDVSSMYFRAFYAIRPLTTSYGLPTNALYGFLAMAVKLLKDMRPDYVAFCFDRAEPSFRKEIYTQYKAHRTEMPADLVPQVPYIRKITDALGITALEKPGYEADDIIGTLATLAAQQGMDVIIISGDKDFAQLINSHICMVDTLKETTYDVQGVVSKWGVKPEQFKDYLALTGDASDNIPGVDGIGPKGAQRLLAQYQSLDGIYQHLDEIKNKNLLMKLQAGKNNAYLSLKLVEIKKDVPLDVTIDDLKLKEIQREPLEKLLNELEFESFKKSLFGIQKNPVAIEVSPQKFDNTLNSLTETVLTPDQVNEKIPAQAEVWVMDTLGGFYLGTKAQVFRLQGNPLEFGSVLAQKNLFWCGYDVKKFWHHLQIENPQAKVDLMLAEYLLKGGQVEGFNSLFNVYVGGKFPDLPSGTDYFLASQKLWQAIEVELKNRKLDALFNTIDIPLVSILYAMERRGIKINTQELHHQSAELTQELKQLEGEILKEVGITFNLASPKQLADVLFNKLKIPPLKKTKTGYSTDSEVLEKLSFKFPICKKIIEHREIAKLKSTYVDILPLLVNPSTQRVHTHFNQVGTTTGRLSSHDPNLQNIPIRTPRGARIRKAFVADSGYELISSDYSQIELRLLAHISGDEGLTEAFQKDLDIHAATASLVFNVDIESVTPQMRRTAKAINFGIAYGQGAYGLAESLGISRPEGSEIIHTYFQRFPQVKNYMTETVEQAKRDGYVETLFGRRRYISELKSSSPAVRKFGERAAINAPIQGAAADLVKLAMIELFKQKHDMLLQVHDELLFECATSDVPQKTQQIKKIMESVVELKVPMKVNVCHGSNWDEAHY